MSRFRLRPWLALCAVAAVLALGLTDADARAGRGGSFGSRGMSTFSAPPSTATAPSARPIERSMTQPGQPGSTFGQRPMTSPVGGFLGRPGFLGGLFAGFLGAGLLGMLFGHGFLGGLGGAASLLGLLLQVGIIAIVGYMLWTWWQRRSQPALASGPSLRDYHSGNGAAPMGFGGGSGAARTSARASGSDEVGLTPDDFNNFEKVLGEVQAAYSAEDLGKLRRLVTPEMLSYFAEELSANASKGVVNRVSDVKLVQGDLAEAWREGDTDYATVAMRFSMIDATVKRDTGEVVSGSRTVPSEVTELWTFRRDHRDMGEGWKLSAVQLT
jgi:predicted lipid-binding transport protein (Tim44 family)